jgi:hypothetical protein
LKDRAQSSQEAIWAIQKRQTIIQQYPCIEEIEKGILATTLK